MVCFDDHALARRLSPHLVEKEIAQTIENQLAVQKLNSLGHVALDTRDDIDIGPGEGLEVRALVEERLGVVALLVLQFGQHHIGLVFLLEAAVAVADMMFKSNSAAPGRLSVAQAILGP